MYGTYAHPLKLLVRDNESVGEGLMRERVEFNYLASGGPLACIN